MKNSVLSEEPPAPELVEAYGERLQALGVLDFDDLLSEALKLDAAGRRSFHHLLVDEFQDLNDAQYELVQAWYRNGKSLFVIGDPDQSIYGFRGASGRCFQRLRQAYPDAAEIHLAEKLPLRPRYSTGGGFGHPSQFRRPANFAPTPSEGPAVRLVQAADGFSEAVFIAKEINRMTGGVDMLEAQALGHEREARAFSDIAVLCRTRRQLELVEKCLRHDDIPCVVSGREDYLEDSGVRGMLAFLHMLQVPADGAALETALRLLWDCPADLVEKVRPTCQMQTVFDPELFREIVRGYGVLEAWLDRAQTWLPLLAQERPHVLVERWSEMYGPSPALDRLRNAAVFHERFQEFWSSLVLGQEADLRRAAGKGWESGAVRLMTLHGAKGLEFPAVFLAGLTAGTLPWNPSAIRRIWRKNAGSFTSASPAPERS